MLSLYHTLKCFVVVVGGATDQNYAVTFVVGVAVVNCRCCVNEIVPVFLGRC